MSLRKCTTAPVMYCLGNELSYRTESDGVRSEEMASTTDPSQMAMMTLKLWIRTQYDHQHRSRRTTYGVFQPSFCCGCILFIVSACLNLTPTPSIIGGRAATKQPCGSAKCSGIFCLSTPNLRSYVQCDTRSCVTYPCSSVICIQWQWVGCAI